MGEETIREFLSRDHGRLDGLLARAAANPNQIDREAYDEFRRGLLRHIGMEEKILLPAAQRLRGGEPLELAAKLRLDHGALAALLVPPPTKIILKALRTILEGHNRLEEDDGGVYEICEQLAGDSAGGLLAQLRAAPEVPAAANVDSPRVEAATRRALLRAGYSERLLDG
jgi:hypothetical protein